MIKAKKSLGQNFLINQDIIKKIINVVENINNIIEFKKPTEKLYISKKEPKKAKTDTKKTKSKKVLKTLWVRRKKKTK